jgi:hypothetical protein
MIVAALGLDRLGDEARDVVRVRIERRPRLGEGAGLGGLDARQVLLEREGDGRYVDPRPVEGREPVGLGRVGVGQRHRVTGPAVERAGQVHHPGAEISGPARRLIPAALPVESRLERVLDCHRAPLHEKQVRQCRITEHAGEGLDELREVGRVHVRIGRLAGRHLGEQGHELGIVHNAQRVGAERRRRKMGVEVEELPPVAGVDQPAAVTMFGVENQPVPVDQQMPGQPLAHLSRRHVYAAPLGHAPPRELQTPYRSASNAAAGAGSGVHRCAPSAYASRQAAGRGKPRKMT